MSEMTKGPLDKDNGSATGDNAAAKKVADLMGKPDPKQGAGMGSMPDVNGPYGGKK